MRTFKPNFLLLSRSLKVLLAGGTIVIAGSATAQPFVHPGLLHTEADFARMRTKVNASAQPWKGSWDILVANCCGLSDGYTLEDDGRCGLCQ